MRLRDSSQLYSLGRDRAPGQRNFQISLIEYVNQKDCMPDSIEILGTVTK